MILEAESHVILKGHEGYKCENGPKEFRPPSLMQNLAPNGKILRSFANFYVRKTWKAVMLAIGRDSRERGSHLQPVTSTPLL